MPEIYLVMGSCGEYSDRQEWPVRAYRTEAAAQAEVTRLDEHSRIFELRKKEMEDRCEWWDAEEEATKAHRELVADPGFRGDYYDRTHYFLWSTTLVED
jgi:hypothetical protein